MPKSLDAHLMRGEAIVYRARYHWIFNLRSGLSLNLFQAIAVTNKRVLEQRGIIDTRLQAIPHNQIESIDIVRPLAGRFLGYGDVVVQGAGNTMLRLECVADPTRLMREIAGAGDAPSTGTGRTDTPKGPPAEKRQGTTRTQ